MFFNKPPTVVPVYWYLLPSIPCPIRLTKGSQVNHMRRFVLVKEGIRRIGVPARAQPQHKVRLDQLIRNCTSRKGVYTSDHYPNFE